jgi:hypothetical protein
LQAGKSRAAKKMFTNQPAAGIVIAKETVGTENSSLREKF